MNKKEVFKDIPDYEEIYQISNFGNIKSLKYGKDKIRKLTLDKRGYFNVTLIDKNHKQRTFKVHVLVAMAFLNFKPNGKQDFVIDHKNNVKNDNSIENLQVITQRENVQKYHLLKKINIGVDWHEKTKKWRTRFYLKNKIIHLGLFENQKDAIKIYEIAISQSDKFENPKQFRKFIKSKI